MAAIPIPVAGAVAVVVAKERPGRKRLVFVVSPAVPNDATKFGIVMLHHGQIDASANLGLPLYSTHSHLEIRGPTAAERWTAFPLTADSIVSVLEMY